MGSRTYTTTQSQTDVSNEQTGFEQITGTAINASGDVTLTDSGAVNAQRDVAIFGLDQMRMLSNDAIQSGERALGQLGDNTIALLRDVNTSLSKNSETFLNSVLSYTDKSLIRNQDAIVQGILTAQQPDTESMKDLIKIIAVGLVLSLAVMRYKA